LEVENGIRGLPLEKEGFFPLQLNDSSSESCAGSDLKSVFGYSDEMETGILFLLYMFQRVLKKV
jgi:hypothetical protein